METRLLHAILSGVIIAIALSFSLIPAIWQILSGEPTFGPIGGGMEAIGLVASVAIIAITLLSFRLLRKTEK